MRCQEIGFHLAHAAEQTPHCRLRLVRWYGAVLVTASSRKCGVHVGWVVLPSAGPFLFAFAWGLRDLLTCFHVHFVAKKYDNVLAGPGTMLQNASPPIIAGWLAVSCFHTFA